MDSSTKTSYKVSLLFSCRAHREKKAQHYDANNMPSTLFLLCFNIECFTSDFLLRDSVNYYSYEN